jgi:hypothetical protein
MIVVSSDSRDRAGDHQSPRLALLILNVIKSYCNHNLKANLLYSIESSFRVLSVLENKHAYQSMVLRFGSHTKTTE